MLLRYSQHVAEGAGIVWNIGEHPVEGATDFLYMMTIAALAKVMHADVVKTCRLLLAVCGLLLPLIAYACSRLTVGVSRWLAAVVAIYLCFIPNNSFIGTGFGGPFLMVLVAIAWWVAIGMMLEESEISIGQALLFSLAGLSMGLTRPEANVLALLMLAAVVWVRGWRASRRLVLAFVAVFAVLGGCYFAWRVHYFGYLLPNPFYVKGGGRLHLPALSAAIENVVKLVWPCLPPALLAFRNRYRTRLLYALLIPLVGYTGIWILLSNENNHLMRFQMPLVPVVVMFLPVLLQDVVPELGLDRISLSRHTRTALYTAGTFYAIATGYVMYRSVWFPANSNNAVALAEHLEEYSGKGYSMAVTEAGTFPFYSNWTAIDTLGLNDATIAHEGLTEEYLDRYKPELILYHMYNFTPPGGLMQRDHADVARRDGNAIKVMHAYAVHHNYILAAAYGADPCSLHFFYIRPNTPDTDAIVNYLRTTSYYFLDLGILSTDFRNGVRKECEFPDLGN
jgi:hypothetical protein